MSVIAVVGSQWGDEGKGRVVDYLAADADLVIRYGGGNNAGHTVVNPHGHFKLHLIPSEVIDFIARKVVSNVRELEGALNRVLAYASMSGAPINIELASAVLSNVMYNPRKRSITPQRIVRVVADYYGVNLDQLRSSKREKAIVVPRQIAMYLIREETDISLLRIGAELGGRDHSTVLHACDKINREMQDNDELRREISAVREMIYAE